MRSGVLGAPKEATLIFDARIVVDPAAPGVPDWWYSTDTGGGWLRNLGTHIFDLIRYTMGEFEAVSAAVEPGVEFGIDADLGFTLLFRLKSGLQGVLQGSCTTFDPHHDFRVSGSAGTLSIEGPTAWLTDAKGRREVAPPTGSTLAAGLEALPDEPGSSLYHSIHNRVGGGGEYLALAHAFRDAIEGRETKPATPATFRDGVAHMLVLDAIEAAVAAGRWEPVPTLA
jgi:predicted dehydrogenase